MGKLDKNNAGTQHVKTGTGIEQYGNTLPMKLLFTCTVIYYNTPVFFKVSQVKPGEYHAQPVNSTLNGFLIKKQLDQWYGDSETTHALAAQIGKQIDTYISNAGDKNK